MAGVAERITDGQKWFQAILNPVSRVCSTFARLVQLQSKPDLTHPTQIQLQLQELQVYLADTRYSGSFWRVLHQRATFTALHLFPSEIFNSFCLRFVYVYDLSPASAPPSTSLSLSTSMSTLTHAQRRINNADPLAELQLTRSPSALCSFSCSRRIAHWENLRVCFIETVIKKHRVLLYLVCFYTYFCCSFSSKTKTVIQILGNCYTDSVKLLYLGNKTYNFKVLKSSKESVHLLCAYVCLYKPVIR